MKMRAQVTCLLFAQHCAGLDETPGVGAAAACTCLPWNGPSLTVSFYCPCCSWLPPLVGSELPNVRVHVRSIFLTISYLTQGLAHS